MEENKVATDSSAPNSPELTRLSGEQAEDGEGRSMRVLVGCEFSGVVRDAFIARGHDAVSCDLQPSDTPGPHIQGDIRHHLTVDDDWDLVIAFPPCTHLCSSGAQYWKGKQADGRQKKAIDLVMEIASWPGTVAIENPVGILSRLWRKPDQIIHPYHFGEPYMKRTCLWLKGLPALKPTVIVEPVAHWHGGVRRGGKKADGTRTVSKLPTMLKYGERERSRTFQGIADAMAEQWGRLECGRELAIEAGGVEAHD
jgi:hypothetical protein